MTEHATLPEHVPVTEHVTLPEHVPVTEHVNPILDRQPKLRRLFRLQWEEVQQQHVLLYPEGMVQLNQPAAEILKRCSGTATVAAIIADLEQAFQQPDLRADVLSFLEIAHTQGWIEHG